MEVVDPNFNVQAALKKLGPIPEKDWTYALAYSLGYHRHEAKNKHLPIAELKGQACAVGRALAAKLCP